MDLEKLAILRMKNTESHRKIYNLKKNDADFLAKRAALSRKYYIRKITSKKIIVDPIVLEG
jgi:hypothetical protein